jgi:hypothetical protein
MEGKKAARPSCSGTHGEAHELLDGRGKGKAALFDRLAERPPGGESVFPCNDGLRVVQAWPSIVGLAWVHPRECRKDLKARQGRGLVVLRRVEQGLCLLLELTKVWSLR